ncbi:ATP-dependent DNA ligase [Paenibacillus chungangensis]|uniref:ATP-dependent DNA ligase family profile domain-containing protein n=1 Tax=Paenibacillus chungangensis TaxID=696535 RepID=A0ABW3HLU9_9BACL
MFNNPMLPAISGEPFDDGRYLFEPMIDGQRLGLIVRSGRTRLLTRHGNEVSRQYPELLQVPLKESMDVVLDGEAAYIDPHTGQTSFDILQHRFRQTKLPGIREARREFPLTYFAFDILYCNGEDVRRYPLLERKAMLRAVMEDSPSILLLQGMKREGIAMYQMARRCSLEGVIGKKLDSPYRSGRSCEWIKIKVN